MDPVMGIVGAVLISKWSIGLLSTTSRVLLDQQASPKQLQRVRDCIEEDNDNRVADLHIWSIGPGIHAAEISLVTHHPQTPDHYRHLLRSVPEIVHTTFEVHQCHDAEHGCEAHSHSHTH